MLPTVGEDEGLWAGRLSRIKVDFCVAIENPRKSISPCVVKRRECSLVFFFQNKATKLELKSFKQIMQKYYYIPAAMSQIVARKGSDT